MRKDEKVTVYELIQMLSKYPADMPIMASVIAEDISPLNINEEEGTVDIDRVSIEPEVYIINGYFEGESYAKLEVVLK